MAAGATDAFAFPLGGQNLFCCTGDQPVACIRHHKRDILTAFIEAQMYALWCGPPADDAHAVTEEMICFVDHLEPHLQKGFCLVLTWIHWYSLRHTGHRFTNLSILDRQRLLNQGEYQAVCCGKERRRPWPIISWDDFYLQHTAVASLAMLTRLIVNSRTPARMLVGLNWSEPCRDPANLVHIAPPPYPDLSLEYDVCVIGSGAGGSLVAARAAESGRSVLIIEEGEWISPGALTERIVDEHGREQVYPARDDVALVKLFQKAGVHIAGGLIGGMETFEGLPLPSKLRKIKAKQSINMIQARVVGGGPYINNAIHLEIEEEVWDRWDSKPPINFQAFNARMQQIKRELGVNQNATYACSGDRSWKFVEACRLAGQEVHPLPVSIEDNGACFGSGSDNIVDPFGKHIGGLHPYRAGKPNSYLMRALHAPVPAQVAYQLRAWRLEIAEDTKGPYAAELLVEDRRGVAPNQPGPRLRVRARQFVVAAGAVASTQVLQRTVHCSGRAIYGLGERFTANVVTPVYAVYDHPIHNGHSGRPEPGIAQCFFVERRKAMINGQVTVTQPALENWFHYPGSLAIALTGWFSEYVKVIRRYDHISICGMVVPTKIRPENRVREDGKVHLEIDEEEFELLLAGIQCIGEIYLAGATPENGVTLFLPTKALLLDECGRPRTIRSLGDLLLVLDEVRRRGPQFLNLATAHPQGGNSMGTVVNPATFRVQLASGQELANVYVADASLFPAGCEVNPQLTLKALAHYAADVMLGEAQA